MVAKRAHTIAVGIDFSEPSDVALSHAIDLARRTEATLHLMHFHPGDVRAVFPAAEHMHAALNDHLGATKELVENKRAEAEAAGIEATSHLVAGDPKRRLASAAHDIGASLLVVGSRGHTGARRFLMGSCAERAVRDSTIDVLVARSPYGGSYERVLVPVDLGEQSRDALDTAIRMVHPRGVIHLLHCIELPLLGVTSAAALALNELEREANAAGKQLLDEYRPRFGEISFSMARGPAASTIRDHLDDRAYDLVVMGCHGRSGIARWVLGSVAETTIRHAPCSVRVAKNSPE